MPCSAAAVRVHPGDRFIFKFATHAMLWGIPLVLFGVLASENVSQHNRLRDDRYLLTGQTVNIFSGLGLLLLRALTGSATNREGVVDLESQEWRQMPDAQLRDKRDRPRGP